MSIYESIEEYAVYTHMSLEQAKIRCEHFLEIKQRIHESRKCPKCQQHTLDVERCDWELNIQPYIYCENDKIEAKDEDGKSYFDECDFTDDVKLEYLFATEADFDVILCLAYDIKKQGVQSVENMIGQTWKEFLDKEHEKLLIDTKM